ncbi:MAG: hypothetical protein HQ582_22400, partial [Planctomycetes bacterium]|nr:hypothetical protein [Planctomycetota bacterium]
HLSDPALLQAFGRLGNFGARKTSVSVELRLDGQVVDADNVEIDAGDTRSVAFDLAVLDSGVLELRITDADDLACDNVAWTAVNPPRRSKVLVVTSDNQFLDFAFSTKPVLETADVVFESPDFLGEKQYQLQAAVGAFDLVIYDRCRPKEMPRANTLFIGAVPPERKEKPNGDETEDGQEAGKQDPQPADPKPSWRMAPKVGLSVIIDADSTHPLMQWIDLGNVDLYNATPLEVPPGGTPLVEVQWIGADNVSHVGPVLAVAPRDEFQDAVIGFVFIGEEVGEDGASETLYGTNWPIRASFPVFVLNLLHYLGRGQTALEGAAFQPGETVNLESPAPGQTLDVRTPSGRTIRLKEENPSKFSFSGTSRLGVYEVRSGGAAAQHFAVNLFDRLESDVLSSPTITIGRGTPVKAQATAWETTRRELWKWLLLLGLIVLMVEWYIYHRRVYL